jgi:hypothetical protein
MKEGITETLQSQIIRYTQKSAAAQSRCTVHIPEGTGNGVGRHIKKDFEIRQQILNLR